MTLDRFKEIAKLLSEDFFTNKVSEQEKDEYYDVRYHSPYKEWLLNDLIKNSGVRVPKQCCLDMRYHLVEYYKERKELKKDHDYVNYDSVIVFDKTQNSYGIPIHDGGSSYIHIKYCPWCGQQVDDSETLNGRMTTI